MELLEHFSHNHPLTLCDQLYEKKGNDDDDDDDEEKALCFMCRESVSGTPSTYSCTQCKFFLHKSCAELPQVIRNFLHPRHPLILLEMDIYHEWFWLCGHCFVSKKSGFGYNCSLCDFNLDIKCASLNNKHVIEAKGHNHSFILLRPTSFLCDFCGQKWDGKSKSYLCTTCQLQCHENCILSPRTVKQMGHVHKLFLSSNTIFDTSVEYLCNICYRVVDIKFAFYYCYDCKGYVAHLDCASSEDLILIDDESQQDSSIVSSSFQSSTLLSAANVEHFSHQHCLTLSNDDEPPDQSRHEIICDGCARPISSSSLPFYSCRECNFFLHKACADLPKKILHRIHRHPLTLLAKVPWDTCVFKCNGCGIYCNGFTYTCNKCSFFIDVGCSLFCDTIEHEGHHHFHDEDDRDYPLNLIPESCEKKCNSCGLDCPAKFSCKICKFNIDLRCATFPYTTNHECPKHNWDTRPLHLIYDDSINDGSHEYYCDMCEERRGETQWFYYCEDCDYSVHPDCILGKYLIKFGKSYEINGHPHPLTLVKEARGDPSCGICATPCKDLIFTCTECKLYVHQEPCVDMLASKKETDDMGRSLTPQIQDVKLNHPNRYIAFSSSS